MKDPAPPSPTTALAELMDVSPQVLAAVVLEREGGTVVASDPASSDRIARRLADSCASIVEAAERSRRELGREPIAQIEVATADGHVFVVTDASWVVAAVTEPDPTVGLVFYDLKSALRTVRETASAAPTNPGTGPGDDDAGASNGTRNLVTSNGDDTAGDDASTNEPSRRWRRRNR